MARIRTIKPEFWTDEKVARCSMVARLLFIGTWNVADDFGGLDRSPYQLKAQIFPYDTIDCEPLIQELLGQGLLIEYESGGKKYLHIAGFRKHQRNEKPAAPRFPVYSGNTVTSSGTTDVYLGGDDTNVGATDTAFGSTDPSDGSSLIGKIKEGMLRDGELAPCAKSLNPHTDPPRARGKPRGHLVPFPEDFALTDTMRAQALRRYADCDVEQWFELFRAHHMAHGKAMKSWCAAWVTWIGNGQRFGYPHRKPEGPAGAPGLPLING